MHSADLHPNFHLNTSNILRHHQSMDRCKYKFQFVFLVSGSVIVAKWLLSENFNNDNDYVPQKSGQHQSVFIHANQKNMLSDAQSRQHSMEISTQTT
ncbi:unnamed protein product [Caenorhabditis angaria]|uniref:Uncharacterized protein n=1 Tax=Caenorhabditis angaria TaxID=860376 RepID=A0A9P1MYR1_9PELO|nr:unnamed protein product [Caenorhabditis angaria]